MTTLNGLHAVLIDKETGHGRRWKPFYKLKANSSSHAHCVGLIYDKYSITKIVTANKNACQVITVRFVEIGLHLGASNERPKLKRLRYSCIGYISEKSPKF